MFLHITAAGEIHSPLQRPVIEHRKIPLKIIGPDKSGMQSGFLRYFRRTNLTFQEIGNLCLIHIQIPADKQHHKLVIRILLIHHSLTGFLLRHPQKSAHILNRMNIRCVHQFQFLLHIILRILNNTLSHLHISPEPAFRADRNRVLPHRSQQHKFMRQTAAHHPRIRSHGNRLRNPGPCKNPLISMITLLIIFL